jgi:regulatory protein
MTMTPDEKAYEAALTLLDYSARSRKELTDRLARKKFPPEAVENAVNRLAASGLVNDEKFAREYAELLRLRGKGPELIRIELRRKGIPQETVLEIVSGYKENSDEFIESAKAITAKKLKQMGKLPPETAARRITGFLARRGFSPDTVRQILKEVKKELIEEL